MKRFPAHDPQEYVNWQATPELVKAYEQRVQDGAALKAAVDALGKDGLAAIYRSLVRARLYDIALKRWVRTGVLTKAWLGVGEEAVTAGALHALSSEDVVGPMIRNQAAAYEKGISLVDCFRVYLATGDTITRGRDVHIGDLKHNIICPISHVGDLVPVLSGFALAFKRRKESRVALTWTGEGASRTGAVQEGLAMAASLSLPLITIIQDNGVALGTARSERFRDALRSTAAGHGIRGLECDGNHVIDVFATVAEARRLCLAGEGPVVIYARTFRMGGHATHDEAEARSIFSQKEFAYWGARDPIAQYEEFLKACPTMGPNINQELTQWEQEVSEEVESAAEQALKSRENHPPDPKILLSGVYATELPNQDVS